MQHRTVCSSCLFESSLLMWKHLKPCDHVVTGLKMIHQIVIAVIAMSEIIHVAVDDFNQQRQVGKWEFNDSVITIIDCDIYSDDSLRSE